MSTTKLLGVSTFGGAALSALLADSLIRKAIGRTSWAASLWFAVGTVTNSGVFNPNAGIYRFGGGGGTLVVTNTAGTTAAPLSPPLSSPSRDSREKPDFNSFASAL